MRKSYKHLSIEERYNIKEMLDKGQCIQEVGKILDRSKGTISMEIKRNRKDNKYMPCIAQAKYKARLEKEDGLKLEKDEVLREYVIDKLQNEYWSPDAISGRLSLEKDMPNISAESIYRFIYSSSFARCLSLYKHLPRQRAERQSRGKRRNKSIIPARVSIDNREKIADQKVELGHMEADLTFHKGNQSANIGAMVDKLSQKVFLVKNRSKHSSAVTVGFVKKMKEIPAHLRRTLTLDNGKEFVKHIHFRLLWFSTYFCDPYRPRQKALVEKMNSMVHRVLPKNIDINTITQEGLDHVANILNNLPRKSFGYKTPNEIWNDYS